MERRDDVALSLPGKVRAEAHRLHAVEEGALVGGVARGTAGDAAFSVELGERLLEGEDGVRRGREAELAVVLEAAPLGVEVEAYGARVAFAVREGRRGSR